MKLVSFNFDKINVERIANINEKLKIDTNIDISSIAKAESSLFNKGDEELIQVKFNYSINYKPDFAKIEFEGNLFIILTSKEAKELLKTWEGKEIPEDIRLFLFNIILMKSNIKALQFEDEFNLPNHIPLPRFSKENKEQKSN